MKKLLFWLANLFNIDLTTEKIVKVEVIKEKQIALSGVVKGDVTVIGDLIVEGHLEVTGGVSCLKPVSTYKKESLWHTTSTRPL